MYTSLVESGTWGLLERRRLNCSFVGECVVSFFSNTAVQFSLSEDCLWGFTVLSWRSLSLWAFGFPLFRSLPGFSFSETFPDSLTWGCSHLTAVPPGCLVVWSACFVNFMSPCLFSSWIFVQPMTMLPVFCVLTDCPSSHYLLASIPIPNAITRMNLVNIVLEARSRLLSLFYRQTKPEPRLQINSNWVVCCAPALSQALHAGKHKVAT